jgi:ribosomal protein S18 acetylase RimI-like enzyme
MEAGSNTEMVEASKMVCEVRYARLEDARSIAAVNVAAWQKAYRGLLARHYLDGLSEDDRTRHWRRLIGSLSDEHLLVAEAGSSVVGYAHVGPTRDTDAAPCTGELFSLYVSPDTWGIGVGRAIHDAALARLGAHGFTLATLFATLWVLSTNTRARRFYERQGWGRMDGVRTQQFDGETVIDDRYRRPPAMG